MATAKGSVKAKAKKAEKKDPELEINASWDGPEFWKDWGKDKKVSRLDAAE